MRNGLAANRSVLPSGRGACRCFRADDFAGPRPVVDHDGCALGSPDLLAEQPRQKVGRTTRRGRNNELDCALRLRRCAFACEDKPGEGSGACGQTQNSSAKGFH
jgi:hypothetical protein